MPKTMTPEELEAAISAGDEVERHDYQNPHDPDDYFNAVLYQSADGKYFRMVEMSGFNSKFDGAINLGDWLEPDEIATWTDFG